VEFQYRPDVLAALERHGVRPLATTRPALVFRFVSDLYRYELRRLKTRRADGAIPPRDYAATVIALRGRYPLVSIPVQLWTMPGTPADPEDVPLC
jgi:hypothetical protein